MIHFNIFAQNGTPIGNGFVKSDKKIIINKLLEYANLQGEMVKDSFPIRYTSGEVIFTANNVQSQFFNIYNLSNEFIGVARMNNTIEWLE